MKEKIKNIFLAALGIGVVLYLCISGIMDMTDTRNVRVITIHEAGRILQLEHSINGLIPIGTDYYYLGIDDMTGNAYLIKASKGWLKKNFDANYQSLNPDGLEIKGLTKKVSDFQTERELSSRLSQIEGLSYPFGIGCLHLDYFVMAMLKIVDAILLVIVFLVGKKLFQEKENGKSLLDDSSANKKFVIAWIIMMMVSMFLLITILR